MEMKKLKDEITPTCNYSSSQTEELSLLLRLSNNDLFLLPQQLSPSLIRPVSNFFEKNAKLTRNPLLLLSVSRNEENTGCTSVLKWRADV